MPLQWPPFNTLKISMCFKYILDCFDIHRKADTRFTSIFHLHVPYGIYPIYLHSSVNEVKSDAIFAINSIKISRKYAIFFSVFFELEIVVQFWTRNKISSWIDIYLCHLIDENFFVCSSLLSMFYVRKRKTALNYKQFYEKNAVLWKKYKIGGKIKVSLWSGISKSI